MSDGLRLSRNPFLTMIESDKEIVELLAPNIKNGPWIAGGACLQWYHKKPVGDHDIDVFFKSKEQLNKCFKRFNRDFIYESEDAITISYNYGTIYNNFQHYTIQFIKRRFYENVTELLDNFDITVCQIASDGKDMIYGKTTLSDIENKRLVINKPYTKNAPKRLAKYWVLGYNPEPGVVTEIINDDSLNFDGFDTSYT